MRSGIILRRTFFGFHFITPIRARNVARNEYYGKYGIVVDKITTPTYALDLLVKEQ